MFKLGQVELCRTALVTICGITAACSWTHAASDSVAKPQAVEPAAPRQSHALRTLGTIAAQRALSVQVPRISGQGGGLTLVHLTANGSVVQTGDILAEFDATTQAKTQ